MSNPIKFNQLVADEVIPNFEALKVLIKELTQTVSQFQESITKSLNRSKKAIEDNENSLNELAKSTKVLNTSHKDVVEILIQFSNEVDKTGKKINEERERVVNLNNAFNASSESLNNLILRQKALEKAYKALNPSVEEQKIRMGEIAKELGIVSRAANALNGTLKQQKREIDTAEFSYDAMNARLNKLRSELKALPDAFNKTTGSINKSNKEAVNYQREIEQLANKLQKMDKQMGVYSRNVGNYGSAFGGFLKTLTGGGLAILGIGSIGDLGSKIYDTANKLEQTNQALKFTSGSTANFAKNQQYLRQTTEQLGLEYISTSKAFKLWTGAAKESGMAGEEQRRIFGSVAKAASTMKLSADDTEGVFLALSQIMSKGKVQAEELRGQLGERLPGAFGIAARSMGVTEQALNDMLQKGEVTAKDFLPKFANELEKTFGSPSQGKVKGMQAEVNRLQNAFSQFVQGLSDGGLTDTIAEITGGLANMVGWFAKLINQPLEDKIRREKIELNALVNSIVASNNNMAVRNSLINKLQQKYPDFLGKLNAEKISNDELLTKLKLVNAEYDKRVNLMANDTRANNLKKEQSKIQNSINDKVIAVSVATEAINANGGFKGQDNFKGKVDLSKIKVGSEQWFNLVNAIQNIMSKGGEIRHAVEKYAGSERKLVVDILGNGAADSWIGNRKANVLFVERFKKEVEDNNKIQGKINNVNIENNKLKKDVKIQERKNIESQINDLRNKKNRRTDEDAQLINLQEQRKRYEDEDKKNSIQIEINKLLLIKSRSKAQEKSLVAYQKQLNVISGITEPVLNSKVNTTSGKTAKQFAVEAQQQALKALDIQRDYENAILEADYAKKLKSEEEFETGKAEIQIKFLRDKAKIYEKSDKTLYDTLSAQADKLESEKQEKISAIAEKATQDRYQIELNNLDILKAKGEVSEEDYQKKRTEIVLNELKRRYAAELDLVKKSELQKQIIQTEYGYKSEAEKAQIDKRYNAERKELERKFKSERKSDQSLVDNRKINEAQAAQNEIDRLYKTLYLAESNQKFDDVDNVKTQIEAAKERKITALKNMRKEILTEVQGLTDELNNLVSSRIGGGFGRIFSTLTDQIFEFAENGKIAFKDVADKISFFANIAQGALSAISESNHQQSQARIQTLEDEKQRSIQLAGDDSDAKKAIEEDYNRKIKKEKTEQAKKDRKIALFQIAINTAAAVASVLSTGGGTRYADFGISAGLLTALVIAQGAAQAALVASQPLPEFWKGTNDAPEGFAKLGERGPELVQSPSGRIRLIEKPSIGFLEKGSKVFTAAQTRDLYEQMQLDKYSSVNAVLAKTIHKGVREDKVSAMVEAFKSIKIDEDAIGEAVGRHLDNLPINNWTVDENGFTKRIRRGNTTTEKLNNRFSLK